MSQVVQWGICCFPSVELERRDSVTFMISSRTRRRERSLLEASGGDSSRGHCQTNIYSYRQRALAYLSCGPARVSARGSALPLLLPLHRDSISELF